MEIILSVAGYETFRDCRHSRLVHKLGFPVPVAVSLVHYIAGIMQRDRADLGIVRSLLRGSLHDRIFVATFWVKLPTQGYAAGRLDLMLMAGAATLSSCPEPAAAPLTPFG
jgi:hypothetical protein